MLFLTSHYSLVSIVVFEEVKRLLSSHRSYDALYSAFHRWVGVNAERWEEMQAKAAQDEHYLDDMVSGGGPPPKGSRRRAGGHSLSNSRFQAQLDSVTAISPHRPRHVKHWTEEQQATLEEFIRREEADADGPLTCGKLARRAMKQLGPAVLGYHSEGAVEEKIRRIRSARRLREAEEDSENDGSSAGFPAVHPSGENCGQRARGSVVGMVGGYSSSPTRNAFITLSPCHLDRDCLPFPRLRRAATHHPKPSNGLRSAGAVGDGDRVGHPRGLHRSGGLSPVQLPPAAYSRMAGGHSVGDGDRVGHPRGLQHSCSGSPSAHLSPCGDSSSCHPTDSAGGVPDVCSHGGVQRLEPAEAPYR